MNLIAAHRLRARPGETRPVEGWLQDFASRASLPAAVRHAFDLALEEWLSNIIKYAHANPEGEHWIDLRFLAGAGCARVEVEDSGREFNPIQAPLVDTTEPLETRGIGGLGLHMIRQSMDSVEYRREGGRNILTLDKRLPA